MSLHKVLIANRGEIAGRIIRTLRRIGIRSVAVYSDADRFTPPALLADEAIRLGPAAPAESYLRIDAVVEACRQTGADAVHPGYGFLSERAEFAEALNAAGIRFIGPRAEHLRAFGLKHGAREIARACGVPLLPGSKLLGSAEAASESAASIGYPIMLKSTAGGGGIGMRVCTGPAELAESLAAVERLAGNAFGNSRVYLERYLPRARHVEVQIFGDGAGGVVTLGERDCSLQRRQQKVIEETPAPGLTDATRRALHEAAAALARTVNYESAGTVEFVLDADSSEFYFLEVNTRLQVEHCVTEAVFGIDLVEWMIDQATGTFELPAQATLLSSGVAVQARLYAEDAAENFRPSTGILTEVAFPSDIRIDTWIETGTEVTPYYDPLLAKIIAHGPDRATAFGKLATALAASAVWGIESNLDYLRTVLCSDIVREARMTTATLATLPYAPQSITVLAPGTQSSVQDWPGRVGYWAVGVPPSGPMDDRSFRLANTIVGNQAGAAALEMTLTGPTLRFNGDAVIALTGASMSASLDGATVPYFQPVHVAAGQVLAIGAVAGPGQRAYLAVRQGLDGPRFLGSRATFALGRFGGHATGVLRTGDVLRIDPAGPVGDQAAEPERPELTETWELGVLYGPHGAPDFFHPDDIDALFSTPYEVHYNSARTGVRLIGPKPRWARADGGDAGLHPSNIHDNAYAIGAVDFTGDMPILLGPDGPSLGGFVCPAVVVRDERWKLGQLKPGDTLRFRERRPLARPTIVSPRDTPILLRTDGEIPLCFRRSGDSCLLVEFGPPALDIAVRLRVQLVLDALAAERLPGIIDLTPGIRSLQLHFDPAALGPSRLVDTVRAIDAAIPTGADAAIPSRIVHLPLSWNDDQAQLAMRRYQELVRPDAPWCPSNIEFIRRINGLSSIDDVRRIVFDAAYLVLGLGDVYLGAPVATPLDPRHRLVTTKYNPARTWTPENAVGIGGAYLCIYGMEGPGGYQLFGRTIQVWNSWRTTAEFQQGKPWLLRFFDQLRFYPVSADELLDARARLPHGQYPVRIEETTFQLSDYNKFLTQNEASIASARHRQQTAFEAERQRWVYAGLNSFVPDIGPPEPTDDTLPPDCVSVDSPVPGNVWKVLVGPGDAVRAGEAVAIVESMKMEMAVPAPAPGRVREVLCTPGREVRGGQRIMVLQQPI